MGGCALSDTIGIIRMTAEILEVFRVFSSSAKATLFRGGIAQCFGASVPRTAV